MSLSNRLGLCGAIMCVTVVGFLAKSDAAGILYDENFGGLATDNLNGSTPDVDNSGNFNTTWLAYSGYKQNGLIPTNNVALGAWLPFVPQAGNTYTLSMSFTGIGPDGASANWIGFGFGKSLPPNPETGSGQRFVEAPTLGRAWGLVRANNPGYPASATNANTAFIGSATSGTATAIAWPDTAPFEGGDMDIQIVLDTTQATWSANYFAKRPTDSTYIQVASSGATPVQQDIGMIGFTRNTGATPVGGTITNLTLETSGSIFMAGDVNGDLAVNDIDFGIIRDHLYTSGNRSLGDLTSDGFIDLRDFRAWKSVHEGAGSGTGVNYDALIPEPTSALLASFGALVTLAMRPRRSGDTSRSRM